LLHWLHYFKKKLAKFEYLSSASEALFSICLKIKSIELCKNKQNKKDKQIVKD
jgi:hypothetical protein